ncbi:MAG: hypothetical protein F6K31_15345 [Symploca sp. SIO2G7]|nr:hypothetical protein [Symploca sp. SIO2G7]
MSFVICHLSFVVWNRDLFSPSPLSPLSSPSPPSPPSSPSPHLPQLPIFTPPVPNNPWLPS